MKTRRFQIFLFLLSLAALVSLMLLSVSAADYDVYVNGVRVTSDNCGSIPCAAGSASYNFNTKTLTLKNARINSKSQYYSSPDRWAGIYSEYPLNIVVEGNAVIEAAGFFDMDMLCAIYCGDALSISGSGTLTVNIGDSKDAVINSEYGIYCRYLSSL